MDLTYQQILAQQFQENERLYRHEEEEDDFEEEFQVEGRQTANNGYELEDRDAFREFAGNRNTEELIVQPNRDFDDKGRNSVRYNKDVIRRVFSIDTGFRAYLDPGFGQTVTGDPSLTAQQNAANTATSSATHFIFRAHDIVKNAISVKLTSLELPNRFFNLFQSRGNTSFELNRTTDIADRRKVEVDLGPSGGAYFNNVTIVSEIEQKLNIVFPTNEPNPATPGKEFPQFQCSRSALGQLVIESIYPVDNPDAFEFWFPKSVVTPQVYPTLPQALGFTEVSIDTEEIRQPAYSGTLIESEDAIDMNMDTYIYLQINDWNTVTPQVTNDTYFTVFAKIPVTVDKGKLIYDSDVTNTTTKTYHFLQPTNVQQMEIRLTDRLGQTLQMPENINYSMTLEVEDVASKALYEKLREM